MNISQARHMLERYLPPVSLFIGSDTTGLWELASHLARHWEVAVGDSLYCYNLSAASARDLVRDAQLMPSGQFRVVIVQLDGASEQAQNILLKVLEEPPPVTRFILQASRPPLDTVMSRCHVFRVASTGPDVLDSEEGLAARTKVAVALKAAMGSDPAVLIAATRGWEPMHIIQLGAWAAEASCGRWRVFDPGFAPGATMEHARRVLVLLNTYAGARTAGQVALSQTFVEG